MPYEELPESEKQHDRVTAMETIRAIIALGYKIVPPDRTQSIAVDALTAADEALDAVSDYLRDTASLDMSVLSALWKNRRPHHWSHRPEVFRLLGERMLNLGEPLSAHDVLAEGLFAWPDDVRLRQLNALALARSGATERAVGILQKLLDEKHDDDETRGLFARTQKDLWERAVDPTEKDHWLRAAFSAYDHAYRSSNTYWTGINAATIGLLLGKKRRAAELARKVQDQCSDEIVRAKAKGGDLYWPLATLGEAALVLGDVNEAQRWYREAVKIGRTRLGDLASTGRNAWLLLDYLQIDRDMIESCFSIPRVHVVTRTVTAHVVPTKLDFPSDPSDDRARRDALRNEIERLGSRIAFASVVSAFDARFLEVMQGLKGETHVVLPYDRDQFLADVAATTRDTTWADRCQRVLDRATTLVLASEHRRKGSLMSFAYASRLLLGLAAIRAQQLQTELSLLSAGRDPAAGGTLEEVTIDRSTIGQPWSDALAQSEDDRFPVEIKALLFADAVGFSKLTDETIPLFVEHFLGLVARVERASSGGPATKNTWGDGLYMVFHDVQDAGHFALALRDEVQRTDWRSLGMPKEFALRIALHAGPVFRCTDPVTGVLSYFGAHVSRAARIEPITPPGEVYASQAYAAFVALRPTSEIACVYVGNTPWAKGYGSFPTFHVRRTHRR